MDFVARAGIQPRFDQWPAQAVMQDSIYIYIHTQVHIYMYVLVSVYVHMYVHTYIHTH